MNLPCRGRNAGWLDAAFQIEIVGIEGRASPSDTNTEQPTSRRLCDHRRRLRKQAPLAELVGLDLY